MQERANHVNHPHSRFNILNSSFQLGFVFLDEVLTDYNECLYTDELENIALVLLLIQDRPGRSVKKPLNGPLNDTRISCLKTSAN